MLVRRRLRIAQHKEQVSIKLLNTKAHFKGERHGDQSIRRATSVFSWSYSPLCIWYKRATRKEKTRKAGFFTSETLN